MAVGPVMGFWMVSLLFALTPGVDWAYAIATGIRGRGVAWSVTGMLAGHLTAALAVAAGLAALVATSGTALAVLALAGSCYLVWLGIASLRQPGRAAPVDTPAPLAARAQFVRGLGVSLLNPKVFLLFLALLPQFVDRTGAWPASVQLAVLGVVHVLNCAAVYYPVAFAAGAVLPSRPTAARTMSIITGIILIALGAGLAGEQLWSLLN